MGDGDLSFVVLRRRWGQVASRVVQKDEGFISIQYSTLSAASQGNLK